jgi:nucleoside 2-deoxyribosyltransferase
MNILISASMKHINEVLVLQSQLTQYGHNVEVPTYDIKQSKLAHIKAHMTKLKAVDCLLVANVDDIRGKGYIGASSFFEIGWAYALDKPIYLLQTPDNQSVYTEDIEAIGCINLDNNLEAIK